MLCSAVIVLLAGIVVNNNIVLIDTFAHLKRAGFGTYDAIMRTGAQRLRPVLLTTVTTICGLLPMMFQVNIDFFARTVTQGTDDGCRGHARGARLRSKALLGDADHGRGAPRRGL